MLKVLKREAVTWKITTRGLISSIKKSVEKPRTFQRAFLSISQGGGQRRKGVPCDRGVSLHNFGRRGVLMWAHPSLRWLYLLVVVASIHRAHISRRNERLFQLTLLCRGSRLGWMPHCVPKGPPTYNRAGPKVNMRVCEGQISDVGARRWQGTELASGHLNITDRPRQRAEGQKREWRKAI